MKKITFQLFVIAFCFAGCSNESEIILDKNEVEPTTANVEQFKVLKEDFVKLNEWYVCEDVHTRNIFKKFHRLLIAAAFDTACFIIDGNFGTSISVSKLVYDILKDWEDKKEKKDSDKALKQGALIDVDPKSAGYVHNLAIINMYNEYGDSLKLLTTKELLNVSNREVSNITGQIYMAATDESCELIDNIAAKFNPELSVSENIQSVKSIITDETVKEELDVCGIFLEGLQMVDDNDTTYVSSAIELIDNSQLTPSQKMRMKESLSIGYASAKLWNTPIVEE